MIIALTWLVGAAGLSHVIVGSVEVMYAATTGALPWSAYWGGFMLPVLIGNLLGGVTLVALLNHGQVATSKR